MLGGLQVEAAINLYFYCFTFPFITMYMYTYHPIN